MAHQWGIALAAAIALAGIIIEVYHKRKRGIWSWQDKPRLRGRKTW